MNDTAASTYPVWHPMTRMTPYLRRPLILNSGDGVHVTDETGQTYLSANAALWNVSCGHGERRIVEAVRRQLDLMAYGTLFRQGHGPATELAHRLVELQPDTGLTRVFYTTSGGGAVDAAVKLARRHQRLTGHPERSAVAAFADAYHGTVGEAMAVTGEELGQDEYLVDRQYVVRIPTPVPGSIEVALSELRRHAGTLAAVLVEPVLGSAGVIVPPEEFFAGLEAIRRDTGLLLIVDEVATGFGRTGRMFGYEWYGLRPDLVTMSKGINSGYLPLAAVMVHERVWSAFQEQSADFLYGETQAGNPLACAAALATLDVMEEDGLVERSARLGRILRKRLDEIIPLARGQAEPAEGLGLMIGVPLHPRSGPLPPSAPGSIAEAFLRFGVIVHPSPRGFSLLPPLTIDESHVDEIGAATAQVYARMELA
jgi:adenosylmethionine-8-amino-7-oxononanoate aminotransferase